MRKIIIGLLSMITLTVISCSDDSPKKGLNPADPAIIKSEVKTKSIIFDDLTSYQDSIDAIFKGEDFGYTLVRLGHTYAGGGLNENEVDKINQEFTLRNIWVVHRKSDTAPYELGYLPDAEELIFLRQYTDGHNLLFDTIAYIPSKQLIENGKKVKAAFAKEDYEECRRILQNEYKFKPIDAKGYERLKEAGLN